MGRTGSRAAPPIQSDKPQGRGSQNRGAWGRQGLCGRVRGVLGTSPGAQQLLRKHVLGVRGVRHRESLPS